MVPIGQELEKSFSFSCDVPIQFEYKLSCLDANSDFIISPMLGIVPAEGTVQVNVLFRPTRLYTSLLKVMLLSRRSCMQLTPSSKDFCQPFSVWIQPVHHAAEGQLAPA